MLNPFQAALHYDIAQLQQPNIPTGQLQQNLREMLGNNTDIAGQEYREEDVQHLLAFLQTLTDPCVTRQGCMSRWIPSADPAQQDPLGLQLNAQTPNSLR
jgi:cytochrome c peroxidase